MYMNMMLNSFTLNQNSKDKTQVTNWYLENYILPAFTHVEKVLLENAEFQAGVLKTEKRKELGYVDGKIFAKTLF